MQLGHNVSVGYYAQNQSDALDGNKTLLETMEEASPPEMRTRLRGILGAFLFSGEDQDKKVMVLSGGERARLALACLLLNPFNLLVLDEPTNHLDMASKDMLKQALMDYDGTLLVVSHDREFLAGLTGRTIEFRDHLLYEHLGDVNAFLEKRQLDDMRSVELEKPKNSLRTAAPAPRRQLSNDERRQLQKEVSGAERRIERLEQDIEAIHLKMADPAFYDDARRVEETAGRLSAKQSELERAMESWEKASTELGD